MTFPVVSRFLSVDTETTGRSWLHDRIVEVGVVEFRLGGSELTETGSRDQWHVTSSTSTLVDPGIAIPPAATAVHSITDADVAGSPPTRQALTILLPRLRNTMILGYNLVEYDVPLLRQECRRHGLDDLFLEVFATVGIVDVMPWAVRDVAASRRRRGIRTLSAMTARAGVMLERAHSAADDAEATGLLALSLIAAGKMPQFGEAAEAARSTWRHLLRR